MTNFIIGAIVLVVSGIGMAIVAAHSLLPSHKPEKDRHDVAR